MEIPRATHLSEAYAIDARAAMVRQRRDHLITGVIGAICALVLFPLSWFARTQGDESSMRMLLLTAVFLSGMAVCELINWASARNQIEELDYKHTRKALQ